MCIHQDVRYEFKVRNCAVTGLIGRFSLLSPRLEPTAQVKPIPVNVEKEITARAVILTLFQL